MHRLFRRSIVAALLAVGLSAGTVLVATPASAHPVTWGWRDNHTLCTEGWCVRSGDVVRMWQAILWVDGFDHGLGTRFIDGQFGPNTDYETAFYQYVYIGDDQVDGEVGPITWGFAQTFCDDWISGSYVYYTYCGQPSGTRSMLMRENRSTGEWSFVNPRTGAWTGTNH